MQIRAKRIIPPVSPPSPEPSRSGFHTHHADDALTWIRRSITATGGKGSSHSYSPLWGWAAAYPETTGYLIPTLLHYAGLKKDEDLRRLAFGCADWLCTVQLPSGAFPGLTAGHAHPSLFNTTQILFGFAKLDAEIMAEEKPAPSKIQALAWRESMIKAVQWALSVLEPDGAWRQAAYVPGFVPSYYTRAVWGVLLAVRQLGQPDAEPLLRQALHFYDHRFLPNGAIRDWGFRPGQAAFTHTIAYTLEGFFESALLLGEKEIVDRTILSARELMRRMRQSGRLAGRYDTQWNGDFSFRCLCGQAQLSLLFHRMYSLTGAEEFRNSAFDLLKDTLVFQKRSNNKNTHGALPGSAPFWGAYLRFRYPNWGAKFLLDALATVKPEGNF